jgi:hypothetical protein
MNDVARRSRAFRLTELAHGGGCGCKLAPAVLQQLLTEEASALFPQLLVGTETSDDAAVWQVSEHQCVTHTLRFWHWPAPAPEPCSTPPPPFARTTEAMHLACPFSFTAMPPVWLRLMARRKTVRG